MVDPTEPWPLVSVVVPAYQAAEHLDQCVSSVCAQKYTKLEIVLVDDGSDDATPALCDEWAKRDSRVRVVHRKNGGLSVARNSGLDVMRGSFVTFIDADDLVGPEYVADLVEAVRSTGADLVLADLVPFGTPGPGPKFRPTVEVESVSAEAALGRIVGSGNGFASCGKLMAADLFKQVRFLPRADFEDLEILPRLFAVASVVAVTDAAHYGYRQHVGSLMDGHRRLLRPSLLHVLRSNIEFIARDELNNDLRRELTLGFVMHGMRILESSAQTGAVRVPGYDAEYRRFMLKYMAQVLGSTQISLLYKVAALVSVVSPEIFVRGFRQAAKLKATVAPNLRRRARPRGGSDSAGAI